MDQVKLQAALRVEKGSRATRRLRRSGKVPAVVYGRDLDSVAVVIDNRSLFAALHTEAGYNALLSVEIDGKGGVFAIAREIQRDPVRDDITHLDLIKVALDEEIQSEVPVSYLGTPLGVIQDEGVVETIAITVLVSSLPTAVPSSIEIDISHMVIGDTVKVSDLSPVEGVEYLDEPDRSLLTVLAPRLIEEEEPELDEELEGEEGEEREEGEEGEDAAGPDETDAAG